MNSRFLFPLSAILLLPFAPAADAARARAKQELSLDPASVINESYNFLRNREPEMTQTEYALYERIVPMVFDQPDFALTLLETMIAGDDKVSPAFHYILGNVYYTAGRYDDSERHYREAVERHPEFLRAWNNLGFFYYSQGRYAEAVPCLSKAIQLGDSEARTLGVLGFSLRESGNLIAAETCFMQAVAVEPHNHDWTEGLLAIALDTEQYSRAEAYVRHLLRQRPAETEKWVLLASLLVRQDRRIEATAILETASGLGYLNGEGYLLLGDLCAELQLNEEAVMAYGKAVAAGSEQGIDRTVALARLLIVDGQLSQAAGLLDEIGILENVGQQVQLHQTRAELFSAREEWAEARFELEELIKLDPLHGVALMQLGELLAKTGEPVRAVFAYEAASQIKETAYHANLALANLAIEGHDYRAAVGRLEAALIQNSTAEIREVLAQVRHLAGERQQPNMPP